MNMRGNQYFFDDFYMIVGIDFIDDHHNFDNNRIYHKYTFLLNDKFEFISQTNNFFEDFEFTTLMFKEIKINYLDFFNINKKEFLRLEISSNFP